MCGFGAGEGGGGTDVGSAPTTHLSLTNSMRKGFGNRQEVGISGDRDSLSLLSSATCPAPHTFLSPGVSKMEVTFP